MCLMLVLRLLFRLGTDLLANAAHELLKLKSWLCRHSGKALSAGSKQCSSSKGGTVTAVGSLLEQEADPPKLSSGGRHLHGTCRSC